jgi:hypothetical protein
MAGIADSPPLAFFVVHPVPDNAEATNATEPRAPKTGRWIAEANPEAFSTVFAPLSKRIDRSGLTSPPRAQSRNLRGGALYKNWAEPAQCHFRSHCVD